MKITSNIHQYKGFYSFLNPYSYYVLRNKSVTSQIDAFFLDGISLVWMWNIFRRKKQARISFDMTTHAKHIFEYAITHNKSIFLVGSSNDDITKASEAISAQFPRLRLVGKRNGFFKNQDEVHNFSSDLAGINPDIVVFGMGSVKQEQMLVNLKLAGWRGLGFTCGGFFHQTACKGINYYPNWINKYNLRFLYRIVDEPKLLKRYIFYYPMGLLLFFIDLLTRRLDTIDPSNKNIAILGTRGIPANHGGFETFAEYLAPYLVDQGWEVTVYCQTKGPGVINENRWNGVKLVNIPVRMAGALGTVIYDWKSIRHATMHSPLALTLGYNTAVFNIVFRFKDINNIINMDGIEWKRRKWNTIGRIWLYINERAACHIGNHLIADHPVIKTHLATRITDNKISMIPYGSQYIKSGDPLVLNNLNLQKKRYILIIARPEPENSILQIVRAFTSKQRDYQLVILGEYDAKRNAYQKSIINAANRNVIFPGAIYDKNIVMSLRYFARVYVHGHTVGGTNPSLVEALGAGIPVLAHDNIFNRWVAGQGAHYFSNEAECAAELDTILDNPTELDRMSFESNKQFLSKFRWSNVLSRYDALLKAHL